MGPHYHIRRQSTHYCASLLLGCKLTFLPCVVPRLILSPQMIFGAGLEALTLWSLVGCSAIVAAFTVLAYDMFSQET
jgi:hypothetical protein